MQVLNINLEVSSSKLQVTVIDKRAYYTERRMNQQSVRLILREIIFGQTKKNTDRPVRQPAAPLLNMLICLPTEQANLPSYQSANLPT